MTEKQKRAAVRTKRQREQSVRDAQAEVFRQEAMARGGLTVREAAIARGVLGPGQAPSPALQAGLRGMVMEDIESGRKIDTPEATRRLNKYSQYRLAEEQLLRQRAAASLDISEGSAQAKLEALRASRAGMVGQPQPFQASPQLRAEQLAMYERLPAAVINDVRNTTRQHAMKAAFAQEALQTGDLRAGERARGEVEQALGPMTTVQEQPLRLPPMPTGATPETLGIEQQTEDLRRRMAAASLYGSDPNVVRVGSRPDDMVSGVAGPTRFVDLYPAKLGEAQTDLSSIQRRRAALLAEPEEQLRGFEEPAFQPRTEQLAKDRAALTEAKKPVEQPKVAAAPPAAPIRTGQPYDKIVKGNKAIMDNYLFDTSKDSDLGLLEPRFIHKAMRAAEITWEKLANDPAVVDKFMIAYEDAIWDAGFEPGADYLRRFRKELDARIAAARAPKAAP